MVNKQIKYNIGFNVDSSGLQQAKQELMNIEQMTLKDFKLIKAEGTIQELNEIKQSARSLQDALEDSFNPKLGTVNVERFNQSLNNINLKQIESQFAQLGAKGSSAFRNITAEILTTQREVKQTSNLLDSMAKTLTNTVKWSIASSAINMVTGKVQEAWGYTKKLDSSLNDIRIVTSKSADEMERFAKNANKTAKNLGAATTNYTNAALIYYQQGLEEQDVQARSNVTVKAANVTGQSASEVSEQLTAVWNGYKVVAEEAELYVDKLAAVAAETAADLEELSTGMSKVASAAHTMGVDVDQLSAQLSTIISVTRQDANVVGTALKTIYARMGDLKVDGVDEFGTSLGEVSSQMKQMGVDVLDQQGNLRNMGDVIEEVAAKWGTWTDAQQQAAAVAIAGKRQYNNLIALFENWDMYESSKTISQTSAGTLQKQQEIYMDSLEARLNRLSTAGERVFDAFVDSESMKDWIDGLTTAVDAFANFTEAIGGGGNLLLGFGSIAMRVFSGQIAGGISRTVTNLGIMRQAVLQNQAELEIQAKYEGMGDEAIQKMIALKEHELKYSKLLTEEQKQQYEYYIKQTAELYNQNDAFKEKVKKLTAYYQDVTGEAFSINLDDSDNPSFAAVGLRERAEEINKLQIGNYSTFKEDTTLSIDTNKATRNVEAEIRNTYIKNQELVDKNLDDLEKMKESISLDKEKVATIEALISAKKDLSDRASILAANLDDLWTAGALSANQYDELSQKIQEAGNSGKGLAAIEIQLKNIQKNKPQEIEEQAKAIEGLKNEQESLNRTIQNSEKTSQSFLKNIDTTAAIEGATKAVSAFGSLASALNSIGNIDDIFDNDSLSSGEKMLQLVASLSSAVGMLVFSYKALKSGVNETILALGLQNTSFGVMLGLNTLQLKLDKEQNEEKRKLLIKRFAEAHAINITEKELEDLNEEKTTELLLDKLKKKNPDLDTDNLKGLIDKNKEAGGKGLFSSKDIAKSISWEKIGGVAKVVAPWALFAAGIIGTITIVKKAIDRDADNGEKKLKKISEVAESATNHYNETKQAYESLQKSFEEYDNAQKAIDDLTTGTDEWSAAIQEANSQVLELLNNYPKLAGFIENIDGRLTISEKGKETLLDLEVEKVQNSYQTMIATQNQRREAENNKLLKQGSADTLGGKSVGGGAGIGAGIGAVGTAAAGIIAAIAGGPVGWALGIGALATAALSGAGAGIGIGVEKDRDKAYKKAIEAIQVEGQSILASEQQFKNALTKEYGISENLVDALWDERDKLEENTLAIQANTDAIKVAKEASVEDYLNKNSPTYQSSDYKTQLVQIFTQREFESEDDIRKKIINRYEKDNDFLGIGDRKIKSKEEIKALAKGFAKAGLLDFDYVSLDPNTKEGTVTFKGRTEAENKTYSIEEMISALVAKESKKDITDKKVTDIQNELLKLISKIDTKLGGNFGTAFSKNVAGEENFDLSDLSKTELDKIKTELLTLSDENLIAAFFDFESREDMLSTIQEIGYNSIGAYIDAIQRGANNYQIELDEILSHLWGTAKNSFNTIIEKLGSDLSLRLQKNLSSILSTTLALGGETLVKELETALLNANFSKEQFEEFFTIFTNNDWTHFNAWENFVSSLNKAGFNSLFANNSWTSFMDGLKDGTDNIIRAADSVSELNSMLEALAQYQDIKIGDIIDTEKFQELIKLYPQLEEFFIKVRNGYKKIFRTDEDSLNPEMPRFLTVEWEEDSNVINNLLKENPELNKFFEKNDNGLITGIKDSESFFKALPAETLEKYFGVTNIDDLYTRPNIETSDTESIFIGANGDTKTRSQIIAEFQDESGGFKYDEYVKWRTGKDQSDEEFVDSGAYTEYRVELDMMMDPENFTDEDLLTDKDYFSSIFDFEKVNKQKLSEFIQLLNNKDLTPEDREASFISWLDFYSEGSYNKLKEYKDQAIEAGLSEDVYNKLASTYLAQEAEQLNINIEIWEDYVQQVIDFEDQATALSVIRQKQLYNEIDVYESLNNEIQLLEHELSQYQAIHEKTFGQASINNLNTQIKTYKELLDNENTLYNEKIKKGGERDLSKAGLDFYNSYLTNTLDLNKIVYNDDGTVSAETTSELTQRALEATDQNEYEAIVSILKQIEEHNNKILEDDIAHEEKIREYQYAIIDVQIEAANYAIEMKNQFLEMKNLSKDIFKNFKDWSIGSFDVFDELGVSDILKNSLKVLDYQAGLVDINFNTLQSLSDNKKSYSVISKGKVLFDEAQYSEDYKKWIEEAYNNVLEMQNSIQEMYEAYFQAQEQLMELFDSQIDRLSNLNSVLSSSVKLWKLINVNSEDSYRFISKYYEVMGQNMKVSYDLSLEKLNIAQEEYDKLFTISETGQRQVKDEISQKMLEATRENLQAATAEVVAAADEWMSIISEQYNEELSAIIDNFMLKVAGADLEELIEEWELVKNREDFYLDEVNAIYAIDEIERKFKESIDDTDSLTAQNKIEKVMEEQLKILREKDKLSQYDLDRANAMYEITLKQIALEEAQQTASKMKLTRDASGNYTYQYVSDMDEIAKAEEELAKAQNDLYNLDKERNTSLVDDYLSKMSQAEQEIAAARAANDEERVTKLQEYYFGPNGILNSIKTELGIAAENLEKMGVKLTGNTDFVSSLASYAEAIASSDLGMLAESIKTMTEESFKLTQTVSLDNAGNEVIISTLEELFGKDSSLTGAIESIKDSVLQDNEQLDTTVGDLQNNTTTILQEVPKLINIVGGLANQLQQYVTGYTDWLEGQINNTSEIGKNTEALTVLRTSIDNLSNKIDNKTSDADTENPTDPYALLD